MAVTLDTTVGGASANSTASLAFVTAYFNNRPTVYSAVFVDLVDPDDKRRLLIAATQRLEEEEDSLAGVRVNLVQALSQPRLSGYRDCGASYVRTAYNNGSAIDPVWMEAQCELANVMAVLRTDPSTANPLAQFKELEVPGVKMVMRDDLPAFKDGLPDVVLRKLARFRRSYGGLELIRV